MSTKSAVKKLSTWQVVVRELSADRSKPNNARMSARDTANMLNMLCTLIDNGMPLQRVLGALASDPSLRKHRKLLKRLHDRLVEGSSFHAALTLFPGAFSTNIVQQVKLGEMSGSLSETLRRIVGQLESSLALRNSLLQKLSYPAMVILAGSGLMTFMLTTVVPQFETIYAESAVDLPWVTSAVTGLSRAIGRHFYVPLIPVLAALAIWLRVRSNAKSRLTFDRAILQIPVIGSFVRDIAVLQFLRSVHALSAAGFVPIDAISQACTTVGNTYVRKQLQELSLLLVNGTKLSVAMNRLEHLIPSSVRQLIMVGEHSGNITKACEGCCDFMQNQLLRRTNGALGLIEPLLTVGLATCIGWIVLAMYMPMFKMFDVLDF